MCYVHVASRMECIVDKMVDDVSIVISFLLSLFGCFLRSFNPTCACFHLEHFSQLVYGDIVFFVVVLFCFVFACVHVCLGASVGVFFNEAKQWNITESVALNPGANTGASFHDISVWGLLPF